MYSIHKLHRNMYVSGVKLQIMCFSSRENVSGKQKNFNNNNSVLHRQRYLTEEDKL